jgi:hypothetical protein
LGQDRLELGGVDLVADHRFPNAGDPVLVEFAGRGELSALAVGESGRAGWRNWCSELRIGSLTTLLNLGSSPIGGSTEQPSLCFLFGHGQLLSLGPQDGSCQLWPSSKPIEKRRSRSCFE